MVYSGKVWGDTTEMLVTPLIEIHKININPGGHCSKHKHDFKWNAFYVVRGQLDIEVWKDDYDLVDVTTLRAGDFTTVRPKEFHRFVTRGTERVQALEIYYLEPIKSDIVRETVGGLGYDTNESNK